MKTYVGFACKKCGSIAIALNEGTATLGFCRKCDANDGDDGAFDYRKPIKVFMPDDWDILMDGQRRYDEMMKS